MVSPEALTNSLLIIISLVIVVFQTQSSCIPRHNAIKELYRK